MLPQQISGESHIATSVHLWNNVTIFKVWIVNKVHNHYVTICTRNNSWYNCFNAKICCLCCSVNLATVGNYQSNLSQKCSGLSCNGANATVLHRDTEYQSHNTSNNYKHTAIIEFLGATFYNEHNIGRPCTEMQNMAFFAGNTFNI